MENVSGNPSSSDRTIKSLKECILSSTKRAKRRRTRRRRGKFVVVDLFFVFIFLVFLFIVLRFIHIRWWMISLRFLLRWKMEKESEEDESECIDWIDFRINFLFKGYFHLLSPSSPLSIFSLVWCQKSFSLVHHHKHIPFYDFLCDFSTIRPFSESSSRGSTTSDRRHHSWFRVCRRREREKEQKLEGL